MDTCTLLGSGEVQFKMMAGQVWQVSALLSMAVIGLHPFRPNVSIILQKGNPTFLEIDHGAIGPVLEEYFGIPLTLVLLKCDLRLAERRDKQQEQPYKRRKDPLLSSRDMIFKIAHFSNVRRPDRALCCSAVTSLSKAAVEAAKKMENHAQ